MCVVKINLLCTEQQVPIEIENLANQDRGSLFRWTADLLVGASMREAMSVIIDRREFQFFAARSLGRSAEKLSGLSQKLLKVRIKMGHSRYEVHENEG